MSQVDTHALAPHIFTMEFEALRIPAERFGHRDHLRLAWSYLEQYELGEALERVKSALLKFAHHIGQPNLYHETITFAFVTIIAARRGHLPAGTDFDYFCDLNPDLMTSGKDFLHRYYRSTTLESESARRFFIAPELSEFADPARVQGSAVTP